MMRNTLFSLLLLIAFASCSDKETSNSKQATAIHKGDIKITDLSPIANGYKFPDVHFSADNRVEEKINTIMQLEQLFHLPGIYKKNPFEKVIAGENNEGNDVSFDTYHQNKSISNILSVTLNGEQVSNYMESFDTYYNFDLRNGNQILLTHLFTKDGLSNLTTSLNKNVRKQIETYIAKTKDPAEMQKVAEEDRAQMADAADMYERCLDGVDNYEYQYYNFYFSNDSIVFVRERCSSHAELALDDLYNFNIAFSFAQLQENLTQYGKSLLNNGTENMQTSSPEGKLYKGFINDKYPIMAAINKIGPDGSISMSYWYIKTKIPIVWSGKYSNGYFNLTESDDSSESKEIAKIDAKWTDNNKIIGTWTNSKTNEVLKLELEAY